MAKQPNFLILMLDQVSGTLFADGPATFLHLPNLRALAEQSVRFAGCYTPSPLCVPARAAFMTGMLPSATGVYDNAAEFPAHLPTFAHYLRRAGYDTVLSGKMHFVGPDQLHGFERRLTTDIYPADFGWTPDFGRPDRRIDWWYHNLSSVTGAGIAETSNQLEFDDETAFHSEAEIYRLARDGDRRPFCLTASFTHPHDPYVARRKYWDLYADCPALQPHIPALAFADQDPHSQRLYRANDFQNYPISAQHIARARRAYFANLSYLDDKIGRLLNALKRCRMREDTIIIFCADHGDMLGERGLWFKMSFFEGSARIPLMISGPDITPGRIDTPVSALDILPTILDLAGIDARQETVGIDGESLGGLLTGDIRQTPVAMEYAAEGAKAPMVSLRDGRFKFNFCAVDPPQLFDLATDPDEQINLATASAHAGVAAEFEKKISAKWDMAEFDRAVRDSQRRRHIVYAAVRQGSYHAWDYQPLHDASQRYMRNHMDLNVVEERARFPRGD